MCLLCDSGRNLCWFEFWSFGIASVACLPIFVYLYLSLDHRTMNWFHLCSSSSCSYSYFYFKSIWSFLMIVVVVVTFAVPIRNFIGCLLFHMCQINECECAYRCSLSLYIGQQSKITHFSFWFFRLHYFAFDSSKMFNSSIIIGSWIGNNRIWMININHKNKPELFQIEWVQNFFVLKCIRPTHAMLD